MKKKKYLFPQIEAKTLRKASLLALLPLGITLIGLILFNILSLYESNILAEQYIAETASLYVEQINRDIAQINNELIYLMDQDENIQKIPSKISPKDFQYYAMTSDIREKNRIMNIRYQEVQCFYVYGQEADMLILENGTVFRESKKTPLYQAVTEYLAGVEANSNQTRWMLMQADEHDYILSWYSKNKKVVGCIIDVDTIYSILQNNVENYQVTPLLADRDGELVLPSDGKDIKNSSAVTRTTLSYPFGNVGTIRLYITSKKGILETLINLQVLFIMVLVIVSLFGILAVYSYYKRIMEPLENFVNGLENMEENQFLNDNGTNNLVELESASDKFRSLLRKIQSLKIEIYEKELEKQKAELEYVQEQLRPHFFLNCLSLIHGIADTRGEQDVIHITEILSNYMRYIFRDSNTQRVIGEELEQVNAYVELQKLRYGESAFTYEQILDGNVEDKLLPPLLLQTLVENAIVHGVTLDHPIDISLYITEEHYEEEPYLYICVSDTGKGFSDEILYALEKDITIFYNGRNHVGLQNIRRRLRLMMGEKARINFSNMDKNYGAVVEIWISENAMNQKI
ncbi:MAG: sensor histidine kinase [Oliverpabstia sp.]